MSDLTKTEYQILNYFYDLNQTMTKLELLERVPDLSKNTAAALIDRLLAKGYLEVGDIKFSKKVLARAYRPTESFMDFFKNEHGEIVVEKLVKHGIMSLEDEKQCEELLALIHEKKNSLKEFE